MCVYIYIELVDAPARRNHVGRGSPNTKPLLVEKNYFQLLLLSRNAVEPPFRGAGEAPHGLVEYVVEYVRTVAGEFEAWFAGGLGLKNGAAQGTL